MERNLWEDERFHSRRAVLLAGVGGLFATAGCLSSSGAGDTAEPSEPTGRLVLEVISERSDSVRGTLEIREGDAADGMTMDRQFQLQRAGDSTTITIEDVTGTEYRLLVHFDGDWTADFEHTWNLQECLKLGFKLTVREYDVGVVRSCTVPSE